jgi:hypothetical protein
MLIVSACSVTVEVSATPEPAFPGLCVIRVASLDAAVLASEGKATIIDDGESGWDGDTLVGDLLGDVVFSAVESQRTAYNARLAPDGSIMSNGREIGRVSEASLTVVRPLRKSKPVDVSSPRPTVSWLLRRNQYETSAACTPSERAIGIALIETRLVAASSLF